MQTPAGEVISVDVPPSAAEQHATTAVAQEGAEVAHEAFLGLDSYGWVGLGFFAFVLLLWKLGAFRAIGTALDARGERIRSELAEARALRDEAAALLAEHKRQQATTAGDAEAIIAHARQEAAQIVTGAKAAAEAMVIRRTAMAETRIAAAERAVEAELRARAATLATNAAAKIIAETTDRSAQAMLTDAAIGELEQRLH